MRTRTAANGTGLSFAGVAPVPADAELAAAAGRHHSTPLLDVTITMPSRSGNYHPITGGYYRVKAVASANRAQSHRQSMG